MRSLNWINYLYSFETRKRVPWIGIRLAVVAVSFYFSGRAWYTSGALLPGVATLAVAFLTLTPSVRENFFFALSLGWQFIIQSLRILFFGLFYFTFFAVFAVFYRFKYLKNSSFYSSQSTFTRTQDEDLRWTKMF